MTILQASRGGETGCFFLMPAREYVDEGWTKPP